MPIINQASAGGVSVNPVFLNRQQTVTGFVASTETSFIQVDQLPNLFFYAVQTGGATPISITPQFATRQSNTNEPDFLNLSAPTVMPALNTPLLLNFLIPATFIRIALTDNSGGAVAATFTLVWGAYGP